MSAITAKPDMVKAAADLAAAGYKGERVVALVATDLPALAALGLVGADMLKRAGMNVDVQTMDWGSVIQRRASKEPVDKGGWSVFFTSFNGLDQLNPATHIALRGNGARAWVGWPDSPRLEELHTDWMKAPDLATQKDVARQIQQQAFVDMPYLPVGEYSAPTAVSKDITDLQKGIPVYWGLKKA